MMGIMLRGLRNDPIFDSLRRKKKPFQPWSLFPDQFNDTQWDNCGPTAIKTPYLCI